jgi:GDP-4-dehydro-6-deoxy-D-mannose reductase
VKKVLITGVSGFVGGFLAERLLSDDAYDITGTYHSSKPELFANSPLKFRQINLENAGDVDTLLTEVMPDIIVHLAAMTSPAESFEDPAKTIMNNVVSQINLLEAVRKQKMQHTRVIVISSADVYGLIKPEDIPIDENTPFRPGNPYGVSKITQDYLGLQYFLSYKLDIVRVRPFNHIGPRQSDRFAIASFAKQIAEIEKKKREPVIKVGNLDAEKDFTDVRDVVRAYELLFGKGEAGEAYNLGSGNAYKIEDLLQRLLSYSDATISVEKDPDLMRPSDTALLVCDNSKLKVATGWEPEISIDSTLQSILDYWRTVI